MMFLYIKPFGLFSFKSGSHLLSHAVSSIVPSAAYVLTIVFGMRTGVSHKRIATRVLLLLSRRCAATALHPRYPSDTSCSAVRSITPYVISQSRMQAFVLLIT